MPDGPPPDTSASPSAEDVDQDNVFDPKGAINVGGGFGLNTSISRNPYQSVPCLTVGRANRVTGPRHVLKLINGGLGKLPLPGFTVAAENPVYVQGDYNSSSTDAVWTTGVDDPLQPHSAAAIIADAVTLLSVIWTDSASMQFPNDLGSRTAGTTYYRMAIAGGKSINFQRDRSPSGQDFGTDGGVAISCVI